jgi:hypothetical protein
MIQACAAADVVIVESWSGELGGQKLHGKRTTSIKGARMRVDVEHGEPGSIVYDANSEVSTAYYENKREAALQKFAVREHGANQHVPQEMILATEKTTGIARIMLGKPCEEHSFTIRVPVVKSGTLTLVMAGSFCLARDVNGATEYRDFIVSALSRGMILGVGENSILLALSRSETQLVALTAGIGGIPMAIDYNVRFEGILSGILNARSGRTSRRVTGISTDPVADSVFGVPPGWKIRTQ